MIILNNQQINIGRFPNNEIRIQGINNIKEDEALIEFKYESSDDLIALLFIKKSLDEQNIKTNLYIRYMPYSRMDRIFDNDLFLLKYITDYINDLNFNHVYVLEPHSIITEQLINNVTPIYAMDDLVEIVKSEIDFNDEIDRIVFPDAGSYKRYGINYDNYIQFEKRRDPDSTKIKTLVLKEGNINVGSKCIIIDDLCASGGTCYRVGKILKNSGVKEVYVLTVHTENQALDNDVIKDDDVIDKIFTTGSLITRKHSKVKILDFKKDKYIV